MPALAPFKPRKMLPPPTTTPIWTPSAYTSESSCAVSRRASGPIPVDPLPPTPSPASLSTTRSYRTPPTALAASVFVFPEMPKPNVVGDAGVAVETTADEEERIYWCDVLELKIEEGTMIVRAEDATIKISLEEHPQAAAYALREAKDRVPD